MRFALLGADASSLELARGLARHTEHVLCCACQSGLDEAELRSLAAGATIHDHWEGLLSSTSCDAVIVARAADDDARADQIRKLVQAGKPLVVSHPVHESVLVYFELEMIRQDSRSLILPYAPWRWHPAISRLAMLTGGEGAASLGKVEQVILEHTPRARAKREVLASFVRDMDVVRALCGELTQVSAMAPPGIQSPPGMHASAGADYGNLGVQMSGPSGVLVRWSAGDTSDRPQTRLLIACANGRARIEIPARNEPWRLEIQLEGGTTVEAFIDWNAPAEFLPRLDQALAGEVVHPDWTDATHGMELADAIDHSVARGRTVQLYYDEPSEHATFKAMMSGAGCFMLIGGLAVLILATSAVNWGVPLAEFWPHVLLGTLGVFLLLQLLRLFFPREDST